jgi:hypothetical protein
LLIAKRREFLQAGEIGHSKILRQMRAWWDLTEKELLYLEWNEW